MRSDAPEAADAAAVLEWLEAVQQEAPPAGAVMGVVWTHVDLQVEAEDEEDLDEGLRRSRLKLRRQHLLNRVLRRKLAALQKAADAAGKKLAALQKAEDEEDSDNGEDEEDSDKEDADEKDSDEVEAENEKGEDEEDSDEEDSDEVEAGR